MRGCGRLDILAYVYHGSAHTDNMDLHSNGRRVRERKKIDGRGLFVGRGVGGENENSRRVMKQIQLVGDLTYSMNVLRTKMIMAVKMCRAN